MKKASSARDGMVWTTPVSGEDHGRDRAVPGGDDPQRDPQQDRRGQGDRHQLQVLAAACSSSSRVVSRGGPAAKTPPPRSTSFSSAAPPCCWLSFFRTTSAFARIIAFSSILPISRCIAANVRGARFGQVQAVEEDRIVAREEAPVVLQGHQPEPLDLRVRGVDVHHVDLARPDRLVGQVVLDGPDVAHPEPVVRRQPGPAVFPLQELVRQAEMEVRDGWTDPRRAASRTCPRWRESPRARSRR